MMTEGNIWSASLICQMTPYSMTKMSIAYLNKRHFAGKVFLFEWNISKYNGRKMNHEVMSDLIKNHGGKIKITMPGLTKGHSTKKYYWQNLANVNYQKIPTLIMEAVRRSYHVVDSKYVFDSIGSNEQKPLNQYFSQNINFLRKKLSVQPTLHQTHFKKNTNMITILKGPRRQTTLTEKPLRVAKNAAILYANVKQKEMNSSGTRFTDVCKFFGKLTKQFRKLPVTEKKLYIQMWRTKKLDKIKCSKRVTELKKIQF